MATGATQQLGLALPVQGELSGSWGNTVNNGITEYTNIAIAATLTLTGDGAVTLANTTGDASASNITSTLAGAGTVTAQFAIVRVTGSLTVAKVVTGPSYSKTYVVDNAATGDVVTFKAAGQTGVSIAVGEKCTVYFNGTDYVKVASSTADGVTTFSAGTTGFTPSTATSGAVTLAGTLANTNGGTGATAAFTQYGITYASSTTVLATTAAGTATTVLHGNASGAPTFGAVSLTADVSGVLPTANGGTNLGGATPFTSGGVVYASSTSALATGSGLTFNGTNLGIGTASPAQTLDVKGVTGTVYVTSTTGTNGAQFRAVNTGGSTLFGRDGSSGGNFGSPYASFVWATGAYPTLFATNDTERMRIDSVGNVLVGGTAARGTTVGAAHLDLFDGTAPAGTLTNGVSLYSSSGDLRFMDAAGNAYSVGYRNIPKSGAAKTTSYTLTTGDVGEFIQLDTGGSVVVPDATFATGDAVVIYNNTASSVTLTMSITTAYLAGAATDRATLTLAPVGIANILFISGTICVVTGNVT
jgi:hypothetical protein